MKSGRNDRSLSFISTLAHFFVVMTLPNRASKFSFLAPTSTHLLTDKYLEGRKLQIFCPCLFDKISYFVYASFCLGYQDGLNSVGKKIVKLAVHSAHVIHMCQKIPTALFLC